MTDDQIRVARALANCTFLPGSADKRFARNMGTQATSAPEVVLSDRQAAHLTRLAWKYRRQMPAELVPAAKPPAAWEDTSLPPKAVLTKAAKLERRGAPPNEEFPI